MDFNSYENHIKQLMEGLHSDELPSIFPIVDENNIIKVFENIYLNNSFYPYFKSGKNSILNLIVFNDDRTYCCSAYANTKSKGFEPAHFFTFKNNNSLRELTDVNIIGYLAFVYNTIIMTIPFFENVYLSNPQLDCSLSRIFADETYYVQTIYGDWEEQLENQFISKFNFINKQEIEFAVERNKLYIMRLDISNFYNSIYSHLISRVGKDNTFAGCDDMELYFDFLDNYSMYINLSETKGIPTGPFSSRLISELLMCSVDNQILTSFNNNVAYVRNVDDMAIYAKTKEELNWAKRIIEKILFKYKFTIADSKLQMSRCIDDYEEDESVSCNSLFASLPLDGDEEIKLSHISNFKEIFSKMVKLKLHTALKSAFTKLKNVLLKNEECRIKLKNNIDFSSLMFRISLSEPFLASRCCKIIDIILDYSNNDFREYLINIFNSYLDIIDEQYQDTVVQIWIYYFIFHYGCDSAKNGLVDRYVNSNDKNPLLLTVMISDNGIINEKIYNCILRDYNILDQINYTDLPQKSFNSKYSIPIVKLCVSDASILAKLRGNIPQIIIDLFKL